MQKSGKVYEDTTLDALAPGECATLISTMTGCGTARRLEELGFVSGEEIACVMRSPLGDPSAYMIRETLVALRRRDAAMIGVRAL